MLTTLAIVGVVAACSSYAAAPQSDDATREVDAASDEVAPSSDGGVFDAGVDAGVDADATPATCDAAVACERTMFVTSAVFDGNLGGLSGADAKCTAVADAAASPLVRGRQFVAWLSTQSEPAKNRLVRGTSAYRRVDGKSIADDWTDLVDSVLTTSPSLDENGNEVSSPVWTGTDATGNPTANNCTGWTSTASMGGTGESLRTTGVWSLHNDAPCTAMQRLYCFER